MKKAILIPIIIVSSILVVGGACVAIGVLNSKNNKIIENTYEVGEFTKIDIDIKTADLEFKVASDGKNKVVCEEREKEYHTVEINEETLTIKGVDKRKFYEKLFNINFTPMKVTVYLPSNAYDDTKIKSSTGDVYIPADFSFKSFCR